MTASETPARLPALFQHSKREQWGLAILVFSDQGTLRLQFQDGQQRTFAATHSHLLERVTRPLDETIEVVNDLRALLPDSSGKRIDRKKLPITFDEQRTYFEKMYPEGFADETYVETHRGKEGGRALKKHRDATVERAKALLTKKALNGGDESEIFDGMVELLNSSDLVPPSLRKVLGKVAEPQREIVVRALGTLLYGKKSIADRFDQWVSTLKMATDESPSWQLATFFLGTTLPAKYSVVKTEVYDKQAAWVAPGLKCGTDPSGSTYERLLVMVETISNKLTDAGHEPRDLLDVYEFMNTTFKPAARKEILAQRAS